MNSQCEQESRAANGILYRHILLKTKDPYLFLEEYTPEIIVFGYPKNMNNTIGKFN